MVSAGPAGVKLFPGGAYSFTSAGEDKYVVTYPLPVLQALRSGKCCPTADLAGGIKNRPGWV